MYEDFVADADANFVFEILSQEQAVQVAPGWPWWTKTQAGTAGERTSSASGKGRDLFSSICSMQPCRAKKLVCLNLYQWIILIYLALAVYDVLIAWAFII